MAKCQVCKNNESEYAWQPFGPDNNERSAFSFSGSHYRGFPVVKICDTCKSSIQEGMNVTFVMKGRRYRFGDTMMVEE